MNDVLGGTHILRHTGTFRPFGSVFCKKPLDMGTTFHWKIPRHESTFSIKAPGHGWLIWLLCLFINLSADSLLLANQNRYANEVLDMHIWCWQTTWVVRVPITSWFHRWAISNNGFRSDSLYEKKIGEDLVFNNALPKSLTINTSRVSKGKTKIA